MPLGMEVGLGTGGFLFDEDTAPPEKNGKAPPNFWPMSIVATVALSQLLLSSCYHNLQTITLCITTFALCQRVNKRK